MVLVNTAKKRNRLLILTLSLFLVCLLCYYSSTWNEEEQLVTTETTTTILTSTVIKPSPEDRLKKYAKRVRNKCSGTNKLKAGRAFPKGLLYFKNQHFLWCHIYKAATRTLRILFLEEDEKLSWEEKVQIVEESVERSNLNHLTEKISVQMRRKHIEKLGKEIPYKKSLAIVRHPFDRLVSAFRDKLERSHSDDPNEAEEDFYYQKFGRNIYRKMRSKAIEKFGEDHFKKENNFGAVLKPSEGHRTKNYPIFWEFVQYILLRNNVYRDEHWTPQSVFCGMCKENVEYKLIAKFEHLHDEDQIDIVKEYISPNRNVSDDHQGLSRFLPRDAGFIERKMSAEEITQLYFSTLDDEDVEQLYQIYKVDFDLLEYQFTFRNKTYGA